MFKIESYVTPILLSYVDKYVKDFNPADAQVSLWGGGVALHNLVIKTDVLQQEVSLPFTLVSGRIHELLIQVPWTKIMSEPIVVTIDIIECILSLRPPSSEETQSSEAAPSARRPQRVETPPGYMQALVRRIVSNISIQVHHLILKYVQDDVVMSLNIKHLGIQSADKNWQPAFADIDQSKPEIRRLVAIDDLTLCLDSSDADGKIRFYQEPLLYRCRIELRVLMKLESANNRRASHISCDVFSEKLAIGVSSEQLVLVLRLFKEHEQKNSPTPMKNKVNKVDANVAQTDLSRKLSQKTSETVPKTEQSEPVAPSESSSEPTRSESWSDWAWSWMPSWSERVPDRNEIAAASMHEPLRPAQPTPIAFSVYLSEVAFAFKIMEMEGSSRKRSRNILEMSAVQNVVKGFVNWPTLVKARYGLRAIYIKTIGPCTCGHYSYYAQNEIVTYYLANVVEPGPWEYPRNVDDGHETPQSNLSKTSTKDKSVMSKIFEEANDISSSEDTIEKNKNVRDEKEDDQTAKSKVEGLTTQSADNLQSEEKEAINTAQKNLLDRGVANIDFLDLRFSKEPPPDDGERFWRNMSPVISISFVHERSPQDIGTNPYENIPKNFEHSDWQEEVNVFISVHPLQMNVTMGLLHRLQVITDICNDVFVPAPLPPVRKLTVEECDALIQNLPQRKIGIEVHGFTLSIFPKDHSLNARANKFPIMLDIDLPKVNLVLVMPLYPLRVCSAASQLPKEQTAIWRGASLHFTGDIKNGKILLANEKVRKPCGRVHVRFVVHSLMCRPYFKNRPIVYLSYVVNIRELNLSGSAPRMFAILQILLSYVSRRYSTGLRYSSIPRDALIDAGLVAVDVAVEDFNLRVYITSNITTTLATLQTIRATLCQKVPENEPKQAWLLAAPDGNTSTAFLRFGFQICETPGPSYVDYLAFFTEQMAIAIDPMLIEWLSYKPFWKLRDRLSTQEDLKRCLSMKFRSSLPNQLLKPMVSQQPPPFTEQVHVRRNSQESSSGPSEKKEKKEAPQQPTPSQQWWEGDTLIALHKRLKMILATFDMGIILIYLTTKHVSAIDCATVSLAMENHAVRNENVVVFSAGRWSLKTSLTTTHLWHFIDKDGPTYKKPSPDDKNRNSFPWKLTIADMSCYTMEAPRELIMERMDKPSSLKSQLKNTCTVQPRHILDHVTTTLTVTVVTKSLQHKIVVKKTEKKTTPSQTKREAKLKYFESGTNFVPTSLKDFLRGPKSHKRDSATQSGNRSLASGSPHHNEEAVQMLAEGPLTSLGFQLHADTPPVIIRIEHDQVPLAATTIHCLEHLVILLSTRSMYITKPRKASTFNMLARSSLDKIKPVAEVEEFHEEPGEQSESESEDITTIYVCQHDRKENDTALKTFILLQWVINRVTVLVAAEEMKVALNIDDVITTIDLQHTYQQLKVKIAAATVKYYVRNNDQWEPGTLGGKVLEAREPSNAMEDVHFLCVTITQAKISNLPPSWKDELHPKLLEQKTENDTMWEIYAVVAPLEVVIVPPLIDNIVLFANSFTPPFYCDLSSLDEKGKISDPPFVYLNMGDLRLIAPNSLDKLATDNTLVLTIGKITINPHPDNPICRRPVTNAEQNWQTTSGSLDGRQYELFLKAITIQSTNFSDFLREQEAKSASNLVPGGENPAKKWSEPLFTPEFITILHPADVNVLLAPPVHLNNALVCGSALEFNLTSDCAIELSIGQLHIIFEFVNHLQQSLLLTGWDEDNFLEIECPYTPIFEDYLQYSKSATYFLGRNSSRMKDTAERYTATIDSGVDTATSRSSIKSERRYSAAVGFVDSLNPSEYMEICITMGAIELSLYVTNDNSLEVEELIVQKPEPVNKNIAEDSRTELHKAQPLTDFKYTVESDRSLSTSALVRAQKQNVPLMHMTVYQPNLYYWKRRGLTSIQMSLFNIWFGLGIGKISGQWFVPLITTTQGERDPITEIPPALLTLKYSSGFTVSTLAIGAPSHGTLNVDVERPFKIDVSTDSLDRLLKIAILIYSRLMPKVSNKATPSPDPPLYKLKQALIKFNVENVKINTTQICVAMQEIMAGWDSAKVEIKFISHPEMIDLRTLIQAFVITINTEEGDKYTAHMQPLHLGCKLVATWDAWRRAENPLLANDPSVYLNLDVDNLALDLKPDAPALIEKILTTFKEVRKSWMARQIPSCSTDVRFQVSEEFVGTQYTSDLEANYEATTSFTSTTKLGSEQAIFYKDDLRSGAFKIVYDKHIPMPYQVSLYRNIISWAYPHPRAITRLIVYPRIHAYKELKCVLEFYDRVLLQWEPYAYVKLPDNDESENNLLRQTQDMVFTKTWRFRVLCKEEKTPPFKFDMKRFDQTCDIPEENTCTDANLSDRNYAKEFLGILQIDSYFAPQQTARVKMSYRLSDFELNLHNSLPSVPEEVKAVEGLIRTLQHEHRVLSIVAHDMTVTGQFGSPAGMVFLLTSTLSTNLINCSTGIMEPLTRDFTLQTGLSILNNDFNLAKLRFYASKIQVDMNITRLHTLQCLAEDWKIVVPKKPPLPTPKPLLKNRELAYYAAELLRGRVVLWIHNSCSTAIRVGQVGTDEVLHLESSTRTSYRWKCPCAPKRLRFSLPDPTTDVHFTDFHWSNDIPFTEGSYKVRLDDPEAATDLGQLNSQSLYVRVRSHGPHLKMRLAGRLVLANLLRIGLQYKVQAKRLEQQTWQTIASNELLPESIGNSVICPASTDIILKIKFEKQKGWSGDIPLRECPKENVPWLVKVPSEGPLSFTSVWCRVVSARSDSRIFASIWPLYIILSHISLDLDMLVVTDLGVQMARKQADMVGEESKVPPLIQTIEGRGSTTHLLCPGTTAARHMLSFQYTNVEYPVTREAVPLHYGVTDTSVFEKQPVVNDIHEVIDEIFLWLKRSGQDAVSSWPYSIVKSHWSEQWQPAMLQPKSEVSVRYRAVRAGGGCSLQMEICPVLLLCNATTQTLVLRAHDAAPLCKLENGFAIALPAMVLEKPFYVSCEINRVSFVSNQLRVGSEDPGRYGTPPEGVVTLDHPLTFKINCNLKVALFNLHYEIKEEVNVMGITSAYVFVNELDTDVLVSAYAVPIDYKQRLQHADYITVPAKSESGTSKMPLVQFLLTDRTSCAEISELLFYLCISFVDNEDVWPVPVPLGLPPTRRSICMLDASDYPVAVVVTQHKHEGRWVVTLQVDPCPRFVINNRTFTDVAVGIPSLPNWEPSGFSAESFVEVKEEYPAVFWRCRIDAGAAVAYSGPDYVLQTASAGYLPREAHLSFAVKVDQDFDPDWWMHFSQPVAVVEGEQLVRLRLGHLIKMRVRSFPHSTLIELRGINAKDLSAWDIRRRLLDSRHNVIDQRDRGILIPHEVETMEQFEGENASHIMSNNYDMNLSQESNLNQSLPDYEESQYDWKLGFRREREQVRCVLDGLVVAIAVDVDSKPLLAAHMDTSVITVGTTDEKTRVAVSVANLQIDNLQYESGQFDFAVIATTCGVPSEDRYWPCVWAMFSEEKVFDHNPVDSRLLLNTTKETWTVLDNTYSELTQVEIRAGPLALYIEDGYVKALAKLTRELSKPLEHDEELALNEARALQSPIRLTLLNIHPVDLTLTLHTAVRMYIALDQSPLHLGSFQFLNMFISTECLVHALTVHYLSAAVLGAGWVVGGLELLGAPGALAARVGGATGGLRGVAQAAAAALLRSLSACAGSLARNLDLLAGDEEHAQRAAAARRRLPDSFVGGVLAGLTNFAINILGAVGGLAHHPLVGVAVGETGSSAMALRRSLLGALTKPLSATADLVAYAGNGLLRQTGWDPVPQPRNISLLSSADLSAWQRDCVRWTFRLADLHVIAGYEVLLNDSNVQLILTHNYFVTLLPNTDTVVETIDFKDCRMGPYEGGSIELHVTDTVVHRVVEAELLKEDEEVQVNAEAMARVARYTGAEEVETSGAGPASYIGAPARSGARTIYINPPIGQSTALHAVLTALIHANTKTHFSLV